MTGISERTHNMTNINDRIEKLTSRLQLKAAVIANQLNTGTTPEDVFQHMVLALIERAKQTPEFAEQTDAYLMQFATWKAQNKVQANRTYTRYVGDDGVIVAEDDGDEITQIELETAETWTPEDACVQSETEKELLAVLSSLSLENQKVVRMLYTGYSKAEIADSLKISRAAISQRLKTISRQFAALNLETI
jgi:RNA polymerase sigma factor (sigma-70 family)